MRRRAANCLLTLSVLLAACADPVGQETNPVEQPELPETRPSLPALVVSEARVLSPPTAALQLAAIEAAYISLPPGSLPGVVALQIRNPAVIDAVVAVPVINGGFDPIAIAAAAGDELELTLKHVSGTVSTVYARVPAKRPPVIVRTFPTKGRTDVALAVIPNVIFSEPVDERTLNAGVRLFRGTEEVPVHVETSVSQPWNVQLVPNAELEPATAYELRIERAVRDLDGDSLGVPLNVSFTTVAPDQPPAPPPPPPAPPLPVPASRIAFVSSRDGGWDLYVANADGSDVERVRAVGWSAGGSGCMVNSANWPSISPDGTRIVFVPEWMGPAGACLITADGSSERPLPFAGPGSWSPDGTKILHRFLGGDNDIYTINSDGTGSQRILDLDSVPGLEPLPPNHYRPVYTEWLPDRTIAIVADARLWSMNEDGSDVRALDGTVPGDYLDWSADGTRIAFVTYVTGTYAIGSVAADGTDLRIHFSTPDYVSDPEWSPDGRYIAFVRELEGPIYRIFVVDVESGALAPLLPEADTGSPYSDWDVTWAQGVR